MPLLAGVPALFSNARVRSWYAVLFNVVELNLFASYPRFTRVVPVHGTLTSGLSC